MPDPGFVAYPMLTRLAGAEAVPYGLGPGFGLDLEAKGHHIFFEDDAETVFTGLIGGYLSL